MSAALFFRSTGQCSTRPSKLIRPYLKPETLLAELTFAYMHAQLCNAALHAFAAENEARMEAMAGAHGEIERNLNSLLSMQRILRQEEITAEILELAAGVAATAGFASRNC